MVNNKKDIAIRIKHLYKNYRIYKDKNTTIKEKLLFFKRNKYSTVEVLKDINIDIKKGEHIAVIGINGCGKSTLLKLISRIIYPNKGSIDINGRVVSLLELGAGFDIDFTGRENIFFNASMFGCTFKDIEKKVDDIIEFSELSEFIDSPVRTYSSGMYMRLAFAIAVNIDSDIILIDETFAVGDVKFQEKCINKLNSLLKSNKTILIVSHDLDMIKKVCNKALWIKNHSIYMNGNIQNVLDKYKKDGDNK